jgi:hypothetical protein
MQSEINHHELMLITARARADKAINSLKGILEGIISDGRVLEDEINELNEWSKAHDFLVSRKPFNEFMKMIDLATSEAHPSMEEVEDMLWLCQKFEVDNYYYNAVTADLQTLQGLCHGLLADGALTDVEIVNLHNWLEENVHLATYFPYDELRSLLFTILADGRIENDERLILMSFFNQFIQIQDDRIREKVEEQTKGFNVFALCSTDAEINFESKIFCLSGMFSRMSKSEIAGQIVAAGGVVTAGLTRKTDYLIIGDNGNPAWTFACYGRKVEKAMEMRKSGHNVVIVHEYDLFDALESLD